MLRCSVCGAESDDLTVVCPSCKSFLQAKVDALNLFETAWGLMESPRATFRRIVLSRHKNYVVFLSALIGIALAFSWMWFKTLGPRFSDLATLVGTGIGLGIPLGIAAIVLLAALMRGTTRLVGGKGSYRSLFAVAAYAFLPVVFSLILVLPLELALFGIYFFDKNPPPFVINPVAYVVLLGFDCAAALWSVSLLAKGVSVATGLPVLKSWGAVAVTVAVVGVMVSGFGVF
jgi:hypothetical protein